MDEFSTPTTTTGNGHSHHGIEWKQATSKKLTLSRSMLKHVFETFNRNFIRNSFQIKQKKKVKLVGYEK